METIADTLKYMAHANINLLEFYILKIVYLKCNRFHGVFHFWMQFHVSDASTSKRINERKGQGMTS